MLQRWITAGLQAMALLVLLGAPALWAADVQGVRLWRAPDNTRLVFDLNGPVQYSMTVASRPERVVLDIRDARLQAAFDRLKLGNTPIRRIDSAMLGDGTLRVMLELSALVTPKSFTLTPNQRYGHRLVLDLFDQAPALSSRQPVAAPAQANTGAAPLNVTRGQQAAAPAASAPRTSQRDVVIAIDAGHGGEDPGAIGPGGIKEKTVVLAIARELQRVINSERGFRAELVRTGDYQIPLRKRPQIAREKGADLFVSIHADAYRTAAARGASVFTLSQSGASSETARWLANSENAADLIGGVHTTDDEDLNAVLLDLSMTGSLAHSTRIGSSVLQSMNKVTSLHKRKVERAGFAVLKSPDIPSILVETGFISNPGEARRLATRGHQQALARSIHAGIRQFFTENPPHGTWLAWQRDRRGGALAMAGDGRHVVGNGESLGLIAQRYGVSLRALRQINGLSGDTIRVGQRLKIPPRVVAR